MAKVVAWSLLVSLAGGKLLHFRQNYPTIGQENEVQYDFSYAIDDLKSGVVTDRWEERRGGLVKGTYSLLEPGGRVRTVDYSVDGGGGFQAIVRTVQPGYYYLSRQEFLKSVEKHPQPSPELEIPSDLGNFDTRNDGSPPLNYHAINAQIIGFQKLFGRKANFNNRNRRFPRSEVQ